MIDCSNFYDFNFVSVYRMFRGKSPVQRETTRRKTYDGREVTLVSLDTQTDWDWVSDVEAGTARSLDSES